MRVSGKAARRISQGRQPGVSLREGSQAHLSGKVARRISQECSQKLPGVVQQRLIWGNGGVPPNAIHHSMSQWRHFLQWRLNYDLCADSTYCTYVASSYS